MPLVRAKLKSRFILVSIRSAIVKDVLHCPQIGMNLLSVTLLTKVGAQVQFTENKCEIFNPDDELIGIAHFSDGLFRLPCTIIGIEHAYITKYMSQLVTGCVTCHTCHGCVTDFRPILGNPMEVTLVTSPGHVYIFPC